MQLLLIAGFPEENEERLHGNRNGIVLIGEIRKGNYGKYHAIMPIAFNSAETDYDKSWAALSHGGNTKSFKKGSLYGAMTVGTSQDNFTEQRLEKLSNGLATN